ncbi:hypothetical protein ACFLRY_01480 [Bacteroidota bacterium]
MKRFSIIIITFFIAFASFSQDLDEILEGHFEAIGQDEVSKINSFEFKSTVNQQGMEFPMIIYQYRPKMFKQLIEVQGQKIITSYDGENGWTVNPMAGTSDPIELTGDQLKSLEERSDIDGELFNWEEKGHKLEYIGTEEMEGTEVYVLEMETNNGDNITFYIDTDSNLLLKKVSKLQVQGAEQELATLYSNYKDTEGMVFAHSVIVQSGGNTIVTLTFDEVILNPDLDESFFKMPVVEKEDPTPATEENK